MRAASQHLRIDLRESKRSKLPGRNQVDADEANSVQDATIMSDIRQLEFNLPS
jgi:hypothetical protein